MNRKLEYEAYIFPDGTKFKIKFVDQLLRTEGSIEIIYDSFEDAIFGALAAPGFEGNAVLVLPATVGLESLREKTLQSVATI